MFEVNTPINWLDAQSSCAIWGGDLTSITSERENNYLNTIIPNTVSSYWIGLNDRSVEDAFTWIDGTAYTQPGFVTVQANNEADDCVHAINDSNWYPVSCTYTQTSFICKAASVVLTGISIILTNFSSILIRIVFHESFFLVDRFGELINEGLNFQIINANTFLFNSLTLACGGEESSTISWKFSQISDFTTSDQLTATSSSLGTGLSWLYVDISKQGYYQCQIGNGVNRIIGLYDQSITTGQFHIMIIDERRNVDLQYYSLNSIRFCMTNNCYYSIS